MDLGKWKAKKKTQKNRKFQEEVSHDFLKESVEDYLKNGGRIVKMFAKDDQRPVSERPPHISRLDDILGNYYG